MSSEKQWCLYILRCGDDTLYTGITNDFPHRFAMHQSGKGAKYTRGRAPLTLVYKKDCADKSEALKEEYRVKQLTRTEKLELCKETEK